MSTRAPLVFPAVGRHTVTVIFAHGLGDTGYGWASAVSEWRRAAKLDEVKFVLPHAPTIPITCNMGYRMPGWYDIVSLDGTIESLRRAEDEPGILRTRDYLHSLIRQEAEALGGKTERIVLGGFSQGGAASLFAGLTAPSRLGGILAVSGYLPISRKFTEILAKDEGKNDVNRNTKILMTHGEADAVVAYDLGRLSAEMLKNHGFDVTVKSYKGLGHQVCSEEMDEIAKFLSERLSPGGDEEKPKTEEEAEKSEL